MAPALPPGRCRPAPPLRIPTPVPADRELALPASGAAGRDLARRLGVAGFWRWWLRMLASLVPAGPRAALERRRMRPVIAFAGDQAFLWQPQGREGRVELV